MNSYCSKFNNVVKHLLSLDHNQLEDVICVSVPSNKQLNNLVLEEGLCKKKEDVFSFDIVNEEKEISETKSGFDIELFLKNCPFI